MKSNLDAHGIFRERLAQYLEYVASSGRDADILSVSFQFLADNKDNQLGEVVGLVQSRSRPLVASGHGGGSPS
jgi:hypothetical protein